MRKLHYHLLDVFTNRPFGGNQLAVYTNGRGLSTALMQAIAKEMNFSETTFVLPPDDPANDYRVRIFTPASELPIAGHPTVGTSYVLARERMIGHAGEEANIVLEEGVGPVAVRIELKDGEPVFAEMRQPLPTFGRRFEDPAPLAEMLSLDARDIAETGLVPEVVSCGQPFLYVPVRDLSAIRRIRLRLDVWDRLLGGSDASNVFVFTREVEHAGSTVHSRMFAPGIGIGEDAATGAASGPLGCYLVRHQVFPTDGDARFTSEQGIEMGRPSFIKIRIEHDGRDIRAVRVGGECVFMGEGFLEVMPDE
ncbi:MAG TPA: PhzF family phenazine biosynthesis protein [Pyrinomonadaceae bacterium]|nr:PhzF family phenazine biosynthesis protein [Pyrinomonadaceae bacterium]